MSLTMVKQMKAKSEELIKAIALVRELRRKERDMHKVTSAKEYLEQYENEYGRARTIFFGVRASRRTVKKYMPESINNTSVGADYVF